MGTNVPRQIGYTLAHTLNMMNFYAFTVEYMCVKSLLFIRYLDMICAGLKRCPLGKFSLFSLPVPFGSKYNLDHLQQSCRV